MIFPCQGLLVNTAPARAEGQQPNILAASTRFKNNFFRKIVLTPLGAVFFRLWKPRKDESKVVLR